MPHWLGHFFDLKEYNNNELVQTHTAKKSSSVETTCSTSQIQSSIREGTGRSQGHWSCESQKEKIKHQLILN
jgi:hypothetical protein